MPVYCYECPACGHVTDLFLRTIAKGIPTASQCVRCGARAGRSYRAEAGAHRNADTGEIISVAAGVHPDRAAEAERELAHLGVRYDCRTGNAIFRNRRHKLKCIKAMGLHDKDEVRG